MAHAKDGPVQQTGVQFEPSDHCKIGDVVDGRFKVLTKIGQGGFGEIYKALDTQANIDVALKVEDINPKKPNVEINTLTRFQNTPYCPKMYAKGLYMGDSTYIAMQLLGKNLSALRKQCNLEPPRFSLCTCFNAFLQMTKAVESLHNIGFLHRDINPANFNIGLEDQGKIFMIDYGLSRYYLTPQGALRPCRAKVSFRGTLKYASLNCHEEKDLSRLDDMWSLFYSFHELLTGFLPWKETQDPEVVYRLKKVTIPELMCFNSSLPHEMADYVKLVRVLTFTDKPAYNDMVECFNHAIKRLGFKPNEPFEWQLANCHNLTHWQPPKK